MSHFKAHNRLASIVFCGIVRRITRYHSSQEAKSETIQEADPMSNVSRFEHETSWFFLCQSRIETSETLLL